MNNKVCRVVAAGACAAATAVVAQGVAPAKTICSVYPAGQTYVRLSSVSANRTSCAVARAVGLHGDSVVSLPGRRQHLIMNLELLHGGTGDKYRSGSSSVRATTVVKENGAVSESMRARVKFVRHWVRCGSDPHWSAVPDIIDVEWRSDTAMTQSPEMCQESFLLAESYTTDWTHVGLRRGITRFWVGRDPAERFRVSTRFATKRVGPYRLPWDTVTLSRTTYPLQIRFVSGGD